MGKESAGEQADGLQSAEADTTHLVAREPVLHPRLSVLFPGWVSGELVRPDGFLGSIAWRQGEPTELSTFSALNLHSSFSAERSFSDNKTPTVSKCRRPRFQSGIASSP